MKIEIIMMVLYIIVVLVVCKLWSMHVVKQYKKRKNVLFEIFYTNIGNLLNGKIELAGDGPDGNNDFEVAKAISKVNISENIRVKL